jgi:hypothetical protein
VHGQSQNIEKGYDEDRGLHFYRLFFTKEE